MQKALVKSRLILFLCEHTALSRTLAEQCRNASIYGGVNEGLMTILETKAEAEDGRDAERLADMKEFLLGSMV